MSTENRFNDSLAQFALFAPTMCALPVLPGAQTAIAHNGKSHIEGTVSTIEKRKLVVKLQNGRSVSVRLSDETVYLGQGSGGANAADLTIGRHVSIESFGMPGAEQTALEVFITKQTQVPSQPVID